MKSLKRKSNDIDEKNKSVAISSYTTSTMNKGLDLPCELIMEILSLVPSKNLFHCSHVCKAWRDSISKPEFAELLLARSPRPTYVLFGIGDATYRLGFLDIEDGSCCNFDLIGVSTQYGVPYFGSLLLCSCNGLLCFSERDDSVKHKLHVFNPMTREYVALTTVRNCLLMGFGFSPKSNQYKVIAISSGCDDPSKIWEGKKVYSLGIGGHRRRIGCVPYTFCHDGISGVYLDGYLHWVAFDFPSHTFKSICTFDLENEQFQWLPLPRGRRRYDNVFLQVLGGCLSAMFYVKDVIGQNLEIWVMKDYGVKESWTKEFVIVQQKKWMVMVHLRSVAVLENGDILMQRGTQSHLECYNPAEGKFRTLEVPGIPLIAAVVAYVPTFISPKDALGDTNA